MTGNARNTIAAIGLTFAALIAVAAPEGIRFLKQEEGRSLTKYYDIVGVLTQCDGETDLSLLPKDRPATHEECDALTDRRFREYAWKVWQLLNDGARQQLTTKRLIAYTSFAYNYGVTAFKNSTMLRLANSGAALASCGEFDRWANVKTARGSLSDMRDRNGGLTASVDGLKDCFIRAHGCYGVYLRRQKEKELCQQ